MSRVRKVASPTNLSTDLGAWFASKGWRPMEFQEEAWAAYARGESGLIHAPTGLGKTLAAWLGPVMQCAHEEGLRVMWITPLRALAADTVRSLQESLEGANLKRKVEGRTGDTSWSVRQRQKLKPPFALVTTPESLSLMMTDEERVAQLSGLRAVIVDEWHELIGSKRGVQTELCLERTMNGVPARTLVLKKCARLTPLAFPLWAARISSQVSTEDRAMKLARMLSELEAAAQ